MGGPLYTDRRRYLEGHDPEELRKKVSSEMLALCDCSDTTVSTQPGSKRREERRSDIISQRQGSRRSLQRPDQHLWNRRYHLKIGKDKFSPDTSLHNDNIDNARNASFITVESSLIPHG